MIKREFIVTGEGSDACESIVDCIDGLLRTRAYKQLRVTVEAIDPGTQVHDPGNDDCPLNDPETFANPATRGLGCSCGKNEK